MPQLLESKLARLPENTQTGEGPSSADQRLRNRERFNRPHCFNHHIESSLLGHCQGRRNHLVLPAEDTQRMIRAHGIGDLEPGLAPPHHDRHRRTEQILRHLQDHQPDRTGSDDGDRSPGLDIPVQNPTFIRSRDCIRQRNRDFGVDALGQRMQRKRGMRDAHVLGLSAIDLVPENPPAGFALRWHLPAAVMAGPAGGDAGDEHGLPGLEVCDGGAERVNHPDAFVAENAAGSACRNVPLENVQVGAAYSGMEDLDDGVGGF